MQSSSVKFIIRGRVQGVYYRVSVQALARQAGFNGYVKNLPTGEVEAYVNCQSKNLEKFIGILKKGSKTSRVDEIRSITCQNLALKGFEIKS